MNRTFPPSLADSAPPLRRVPAQRHSWPQVPQGARHRHRARRHGHSLRAGAWTSGLALPAACPALHRSASAPGFQPASSTSTSTFTSISSPWSCCWSSPASASSSTSIPSATWRTRTGYWRFFAYLNLFMFFMLMLVLAGQLPAHVRRLGRRGPRVLPAHRLLVQQGLRRRRRQEGLHRQPHRRLRLPPRRCSCSSPTSARWTSADVFSTIAQHPEWQGGFLTAIALLPARGRDRQNRADSALRLAARRHGRPHAGLRPHPRRHHGHGRRLHDRPRAHASSTARPCALDVVAIIGAATAIFAATIGMVQTTSSASWPTPPSRSSATCSSACGVAAYAAGIFHLITHAFFKALLFLAAGSVIHALGGEQDMREMGGLRKKHARHLLDHDAAVFAIAGIPPFAGFFSKDEILYETFISPTRRQDSVGHRPRSPPCLTAFYMFRLWYHDVLWREPCGGASTTSITRDAHAGSTATRC